MNLAGYDSWAYADHGGGNVVFAALFALAALGSIADVPDNQEVHRTNRVQHNSHAKTRARRMDGKRDRNSSIRRAYRDLSLKHYH
jgi:hypothetical protein